MSPLRTAVLVASVLSLMSGCIVPYEPTLKDLEALAPTPQQLETGLVYLFPGLIGVPWELGPAYRAFRDAGVTSAIRFFEWNEPALRFGEHLNEYEDNQAQARAVADELVAYRAAYPDTPIDLVGYSAGAFFAVRVAELLPADVHVRHIVLAQPDLTPSYDLTAALGHVDGQMLVFYSPTDWFLSGWFNQTFGTMDRVFAPSAGMFGFDAEVAVPDASLRPRLVQVGWDETWEAAGHGGAHVDILEYRWNRHILVPALTALESSAPADAAPPDE